MLGQHAPGQRDGVGHEMLVRERRVAVLRDLSLDAAADQEVSNLGFLKNLFADKAVFVHRVEESPTQMTVDFRKMTCEVGPAPGFRIARPMAPHERRPFDLRRLPNGAWESQCTEAFRRAAMSEIEPAFNELLGAEEAPAGSGLSYDAYLARRDELLKGLSLDDEKQLIFHLMTPEESLPPANWFPLRDDAFSSALEAAYQRYIRS